MKFNLTKKAEFRLRKLAQHMRSLPPEAAEHFHMEDWFRHSSLDGHRHVKPGKVIEASDMTTCGTRACAIGWATTSPYFRKLGLRLVATNAAWGAVRYGRRKAEEYDVFDIVEDVFDMSRDESTYFFRDIGARTPKEWASRVERALGKTA